MLGWQSRSDSCGKEQASKLIQTSLFANWLVFTWSYRRLNEQAVFRIIVSVATKVVVAFLVGSDDRSKMYFLKNLPLRSAPQSYSCTNLHTKLFESRLASHGSVWVELWRWSCRLYLSNTPVSVRSLTVLRNLAQALHPLRVQRIDLKLANEYHDLNRCNICSAG